VFGRADVGVIYTPAKTGNKTPPYGRHVVLVRQVLFTSASHDCVAVNNDKTDAMSAVDRRSSVVGVQGTWGTCSRASLGRRAAASSLWVSCVSGLRSYPIIQVGGVQHSKKLKGGTSDLLASKGAITSKIKHAMKHKTCPARLVPLLHNCCSPH